jgi:glycerophosphoryl diester phosphodiesterase
MANHPLIYAHRGGAGLFPEHTMAAYNNALKLGADALDADVQMTADKQIIVHHDPQLNTDLTRDLRGNWVQDNLTIKDLNFLDLKNFLIGHTNHNSKYIKNIFPAQQDGNNEKILSLDEFITNTQNNPHIIYQIEIKSDKKLYPRDQDYQEFVENILAVLKKHNVVARTQLQSFDLRSLLYAKQIEPAVQTSYVTQRPILLDLANPENMARVGIDNWCPHYVSLSAKKVKLAHELGLKVIPWTIDDEYHMQQAIALGVDGIITNRPDLLQKILS